jgi:RNA recognition motif-containing protein
VLEKDLMNIYVGNLSYRTTEDELRKIFEAFGAVGTASVIRDRESGQSKGFGFVEMPTDSEAQAAINGLNDKEIGGRRLKVNQARPREDSGYRGGGGGGGRSQSRPRNDRNDRDRNDRNRW